MAESTRADAVVLGAAQESSVAGANFSLDFSTMKIEAPAEPGGVGEPLPKLREAAAAEDIQAPTGVVCILVPDPNNFVHNSKTRKRTKTGCLTCRKRRIRCGEERPTCANCIRSKRQCEGYNQRAVFKPPTGDQPPHIKSRSMSAYHGTLVRGNEPITEYPALMRWLSLAIRELTRSELKSLTEMPRPYSLPSEFCVKYEFLEHEKFVLSHDDLSWNNIFPYTETVQYTQTIPYDLRFGHQCGSTTPYSVRPFGDISPLRVVSLYDHHNTPEEPLKSILGSFDLLTCHSAHSARRLITSGGRDLEYKVSEHTMEAMDECDMGRHAVNQYSLALLIDSVDTIEYLDDDYYDLESDDDSDMPSPHTSALRPESPHTFNKSSEFVHDVHYVQGVLDHYNPGITANPLKAIHVAELFAYFVRSTGPSLSRIFMGYVSPLWSNGLPVLAFTDLGVLHGILALSSLHVALLYNGSKTSSLQHYAYSLKYLYRALGNSQKRLRIETLATTLLLGLYETVSGEPSKCRTQLSGIGWQFANDACVRPHRRWDGMVNMNNDLDGDDPITETDNLSASEINTKGDTRTKSDAVLDSEDMVESTITTEAPTLVGLRVEDDPHFLLSEPLSPYSDLPSRESSPSLSDTSTSTEHTSETTILQLKKAQLVDRVMAYFHSIFRSNPVTVCQRNPQNLSGSGQSGRTSSGMDTCGSKLASNIGKGKRPLSGDDDNMTDEEDGLPKRPKRDRANEPEERGDIRRRFACPYYQRNPGGYLTRRSCVGPGWEEVRRVKEHLYRTHTLPIFCPRCYATFKSDHLLHEHQRADERCPKQPEEFIEGFDKLQEKQLRSRKKIQPEPSEEDKWKEMYRVLFPDDDEALMPSPYMNYNWERVYQRRKPASDELARYEQFLRRELPPAVRRELESAVERQFSPLEESLKSQLIEIVRDLQLRLFESYTQARNAAGVASTDLPCATGASMEEKSSGTGASGVLPGTSSDHHSADPEITLEDQLAPFQPAPPTDNPTVDFDPILYQFTIEGIDDSGYSSMFDTFADSAYVNTVCDEEPGMYCVPEYDNGEGPSRRKG